MFINILQSDACDRVTRLASVDGKTDEEFSKGKTAQV